MTDYFQTVDLARFLSETPVKIWLQVQSPIFLIQAGGIVLSALVAWWLSRLTRSGLTRFALHALPRHWGPGFLRGTQSITLPLFWLIMLSVGSFFASAFVVRLPLTSAAIDLVLAWICIRLLSFTVSSPLVSAGISIVAWTVAALNVLDLYQPLVKWLRTVRLYEGKQTHITLLDAIDAVVVLIVLLWMTRLISRFLQRRIENSEALTPSLQVLLTHLLQIFLPALAVIVALQTIGLDLTTLTVAFGALGLGVGLGLQRIVANLVAGLAMLIGKDIKPGDIIEYQKGYGWVTAMGARYVTLRTRDGIEHLIPNDYFLQNGVENWSYSDAALRLHVPIGISYDCDPREAMRLCAEAAKSVKRVIAKPEPLILLKEFGDNSINLEIRFWIEDPRNGTTNVKSEVMLQVWDRFKEAGITFAYPHRDVRIVAMPPEGLRP